MVRRKSRSRRPAVEVSRGRLRSRAYPLFLFALIVGSSLFVAGAGGVAFQLWSREFPDVEVLSGYFPVVAPQKESSFSVRWTRSRPAGWVSLSRISSSAVGAVIVSEDWAYHSHKGYDLNQIRDALKHDLAAGRFARGASTITQQVVKNLFLTSEKTIWRKLKELYLAVRLDQRVGKNRVLETYFNIAHWGPGIFGIRAASQHYFGKDPSELGPREGAFLAMLLPSPIRYSQSFRQRGLTSYARTTMTRILEKMVRAGYLTPDEARVANEHDRLSFEASDQSGGDESSSHEPEEAEEIDPEFESEET